MLTLSSPISSVRMISSVYAAKLEKLGITTVGDIIFHIPFRYDDYSQITKIALLSPDQPVTVIGEITEFKNSYTKYGKSLQKIKLGDETGTVDIVWYNQSYLSKTLPVGTRITVAGKVGWFDRHLCFQSPDYEIVRKDHDLVHSARLVPVYPETKGLTSKWLRTKIHTLLPLVSAQVTDALPPATLKTYQLPSLVEALQFVHFPQSLDQAKTGKRRLAFEELLEIQLAALIRRRQWEKQTIGSRFHISEHRGKLQSFILRLPFELTGAQKRALPEIMADLAKDIPMNRLLEGDVGSGKTVVAAIAMYIAQLNGFSSVLMAPTEILAQQHYATVKNLLDPLDIPVELITGSTRHSEGVKRPKNPLRVNLHDEPVGKQEIRRGPSTSLRMTKGIFIGTHALLEDTVTIPNLGLAVIDEQQRFGVDQRTRLRKKGSNPHVLSMTATPIPRTVALTIHADLDLSVLDELPRGRQKIKTWVVPTYKRSAAYEWIRRVILSNPELVKGEPKDPVGKQKSQRDPSATPQNNKKGQQVFIICPLIEESESLTSVKSAKKEFDRLSKEVFPDLKLGLVHGRMSAKDKDATISAFRDGQFHILVATPVVEVGIDIPTATVIIIEAADRFGLAQLHQLRGRVGRSGMQSYCLLFTETDNTDTIARLKLLETIHIGPALAEYDLKLRGGGDIYGTKQHGALRFKYADFSDINVIKETRTAATSILVDDPQLQNVPLLREKVRTYTIRQVAPD